MSLSFKPSFIYNQIVVWGDQDAFGHVNNVSVVRYFENARADYFTEKKIWENNGQNLTKGMVLTNLVLEYRKQIKYPSTLRIALGSLRISSRKFIIGCSMSCESQVVVEGSAELIWFDFIKQKPSILPDDIRQVLLS
jgi:acyl-CoA thioester hydrolase